LIESGSYITLRQSRSGKQTTGVRLRLQPCKPVCTTIVSGVTPMMAALYRSILYIIALPNYLLPTTKKASGFNLNSLISSRIHLGIEPLPIQVSVSVSREVLPMADLIVRDERVVSTGATVPTFPVRTLTGCR
jgi:hypothetical protein